jgi:hypothetical protein
MLSEDLETKYKDADRLYEKAIDLAARENLKEALKILCDAKKIIESAFRIIDEYKDNYNLSEFKEKFEFLKRKCEAVKKEIEETVKIEKTIPKTPEEKIGGKLGYVYERGKAIAKKAYTGSKKMTIQQLQLGKAAAKKVYTTPLPKTLREWMGLGALILGLLSVVTGWPFGWFLGLPLLVAGLIFLPWGKWN